MRHDISVYAQFELSEFGLNQRREVERPLQSIFQNRWKFAAPDPNFYHCVPKSFPATDGDRVYFGSDAGFFYCLDTKTGEPLWHFKVETLGHKNIWSSPAIGEGRIYFGSYDGNVYCLNALTGSEIWRFTGAEWVGSSPALAPDLGLLFIGLEFSIEGKRGGIAALDIRTGDLIWEFQTKRYTHASPAYWPEQGVVACGSNDNEMLLFDATTGILRWRFETLSHTSKGSIRHAPAFDTKRSHVITGCANGYIYIIDIKSGHEVWSVRTGNSVYTVPLVDRDLAYIGSTDKYFYVLDLDNQRVGERIYIGSKIFGPPRFINGRVYFGACNGMVYEYDPAVSGISGMHQLPDAITNAIAYNVQRDEFYALTYVNELYAFLRV
jgi:outer membrane protein assembly factor BamB